MYIYYFLPVVLIGAAVAYSLMMRRKVQNMSPEEAAERFNDTYAGYFALAEGEKVVGAWGGTEFQGAQGTARQLAGAALNAVSANVVGVSTYVPNVQVGLTSTGRIVISREYSELGQRGNYKQFAAFAPGTRALGAAAAHPGADLGRPPNNPYNPMVSLEFVQLRSPTGETYEAWMSPQGVHTGQPGFHSILTVLG
ncbi:hypothetical protein SOCEGT47_051690 [Sorangium cellulosum]|uniref:Uncharacterized protein n=1 Tax=Sorangium cellulosum TaxID=56 RepID=A0A4P2Q5G3_SORCE|nr:hypothetical protein [Sorangium cellulosum]AUX24630.1 hypothetical protein SOCEGT47_051690 [Sorangium cellulosum]